MYQKKRILIIIIALLIIMFMFPALNAVENNLEHIKFLDDNLKKALIDQGIDMNNDGEISIAEAKNVTALHLFNKSIKDISGIEYFSNLNYLDINNNYIEDINCLNKLTNLRILRMDGNKINSTPLRKIDDDVQNTINNLLSKNVIVEGIYNQIVDYDKELSKGKPIHKVLFVYVTDVDVNVINNGKKLNYKHKLTAEDIYWFDLQKDLFEKTVEKLSNYSVDIETYVYNTKEKITEFGGYENNYWLLPENISEIEEMSTQYDTVFACSIYDNLIVPHKAGGLGGRGKSMVYFSNYSLEDVEKLKHNRQGNHTRTLVHEFIHSVEEYGLYIDYNIWPWHSASSYFAKNYKGTNGDEFLAMSYYLQGGTNPENKSEVGILKEIWEIPLSKTYNKNILINKNELKLNEKEEAYLYCIAKKVNVTAADAVLWTHKNIIWKSTNENVATINENGKVIAKAKGKCNIIAQDNTGTYSAICTVKVDGKELTKIEVTTLPSNINYIEGQNFDKTGMIVTAIYDNKTTLPITNFIVTDGENLLAEKTSVTIRYTEGEVTKETTVGITVAKKLLTGIEVMAEPSKKNYTEGQEFDKTGMVVIAKYSDGTSKEILDYTYIPSGTLNETDEKITISYTEGEVTKTVNQEITVITDSKNNIEDDNEDTKYDSVTSNKEIPKADVEKKIIIVAGVVLIVTLAIYLGYKKL